MSEKMIEEQEIRNELIQFLKEISERNNPTQLMDLYHYFNKICKEKEADAKNTFFKVREIINEYINNNVLMWGNGSADSSMPWLSVTEFGKECLIKDNIIPYDPEGYIREIEKQIPDIDKVTLTYLKESVMTYNKRCPLSASVTLGCASESMINDLINVSMAFFEKDNEEREEYLNKLEKSRGVFRDFEILKERLLKLRKEGKIPVDIIEDIDIKLEGIFQFIRLNRNKSGHPTGNIPSIKVIYSNLQIFLEYSKTIHKLIKFMMTHKLENK